MMKNVFFVFLVLTSCSIDCNSLIDSFKYTSINMIVAETPEFSRDFRLVGYNVISKERVVYTDMSGWYLIFGKHGRRIQAGDTVVKIKDKTYLDVANQKGRYRFYYECNGEVYYK